MSVLLHARRNHMGQTDDDLLDCVLRSGHSHDLVSCCSPLGSISYTCFKLQIYEAYLILSNGQFDTNHHLERYLNDSKEKQCSH